MYKVEIGAVLWKFPAALEPVRADLEKNCQISCLGARGPCVAERLIGMQEFPSDMKLDGKASMVEAAVRNATLGSEGEVDTKLHQRILRGTRVWTSDGADLDVGPALASKAGFSGMVCQAWDESHCAGRLLPNALKHDKEIVDVVGCCTCHLQNALVVIWGFHFEFMAIPFVTVGLLRVVVAMWGVVWVRMSVCQLVIL